MENRNIKIDTKCGSRGATESAKAAENGQSAVGGVLKPGMQFPQRVGRYEIIYPIAQGGMGSVFAGRLTGLAGFQRLLAIKVIHPHLAQKKRFIEMFLDEARLAAGIHHPNVAEVFEVGEENGLYYMVCELVQGHSLRELIRRAKQNGKPFSPSVCARIVSNVAMALQAAHDLTDNSGTPLGLVHRDVSPRNIMLSYDGFVKLIDFGVAYAQDRISTTDTGTLKGKVGYMSPEQIRCHPIDARSDVFSLGVVLYELVVGAPPFGSGNSAERLLNIIKQNFEKPTDVCADIPEGLESIILRAMAFDPEQRYLSAGAMSTDLEAFISQSDELVDSWVVSGIMKDLFARERESQISKVRELGRNAPVFPNDIPVGDEVTTSMPVRPMLQGEDASVASLQNVAPKKQRKRWVTKTFVAAALIGGFVALAFWAVYSANDFSSQQFTDTIIEEPSLSQTVSTASLKPLVSGNDLASKMVASDLTSEIFVPFSFSPADAVVELDGEVVSADAPFLKLSADGRPHRLKIAADGYRTHEELVSPDEHAQISVSLVRSTVPDPAKPANWSEKDNRKKNAGTPTSGRATRVKKNMSGKKNNSARNVASPALGGALSNGDSVLLQKSPYH